MTYMKKIRVGVIGTGALGQHHVRIYHELPDAELITICDSDKERGKELANKYGVGFTTNYHDLIGSVDAVSIAIPNISSPRDRAHLPFSGNTHPDRKTDHIDH